MLRKIIVISLLGLAAPYLGAADQESSTVINIVLPQVPKVPQVTAIVPEVHVVNGQKSTETPHKKEKKSSVAYTKKEVKSRYVHVDYVNLHHQQNDGKVEVGDINEQGSVSAYLQGKFISEKEVKRRLEEAGFSVLASYKIDKAGKIRSLVFTSKDLETQASKKTRGFAGTLRVVVNSTERYIRITNPLYFMKAFLQENYTDKIPAETLRRLRDTFTGLENSTDALKFRTLSSYRFMKNMPQYQEMRVIVEGNNQALLDSVRKSKSFVYEQQLDNGAVVVGVKLGKRTQKFVKKIGYENSALLPYPLLIEDNSVKILAPKYYIAVSYPLLKISKFMEIATIPGAIERDIDKIFR